MTAISGVRYFPFSRDLRANFESSRLRVLDVRKSISRDLDTSAPAPSRNRNNIALRVTLDMGRERAIRRIRVT